MDLKNTIRYSFIAATMLLAFSCTKDLVVKSVKNATVNVLAPANNTITSDNAVTFWWDAVEGADKYNIQIVKPNFNAIQRLITDTNVTGNKYTQNLSPGVYQWRIKAVNGGGSSAYTLYNLTIDSTSNLTGQLVVPVSPLSGYLTRNRLINFSWSQVNAATAYSIELSSNNTVVTSSVITGTSFSYSMNLASGSVYTGSWRVKALNNNSVSQYNTPQTFTVILNQPGTPVLSSPANYAQVKDTVSLVWVSGSGAFSKYDSLTIATDSLFTGASVIRNLRVNNTRIKINALNSIPSSSTTGLPYYYWRVFTVDTVKNVSNPSTVNKFKLY